MHKNLNEINLVYNDQTLGIHADLEDPAFQIYPVFSDHNINLKINCLSLKAFSDCCIDLNNFPKLETFYGYNCEISVNHDHPSLRVIYLNQVTFSSLPTNLIKLVTSRCRIRMSESHPKLGALTVLVLENTLEPFDCSSLLQALWNKGLEQFTYIGRGVIEEDEIRGENEEDESRGVIEEDEIFALVGPKVTTLGFSGSISARVPRLLHSIYSINGGSLENLSAFTHMTSLTLQLPAGNINSCELPPNLLRLTVNLPEGTIDRLKLPINLLKLSITSAKFEDLAKVEFPPNLVDLKLELCDITLTTDWLKPAHLKRLSLEDNKLSSFKAFLPCCEYLCLRSNTLTEVEIEAPVLEHINLTRNELTSIPKLSDSLQVLIIGNNRLYLPQMPELPSNLKLLDLCRAGTGSPRNYTFPSSIQELHLTQVDLSHMIGVKFAKGSKLKKLNLSRSSLRIIDDKMIELPPGLESLDLYSNCLMHIKKLTIQQTDTYLDLEFNYLRYLRVNSHIETLKLGYNCELSGLTIPNNLELKYLDLTWTPFKKFPFGMVRAEKLTQLCLGYKLEVIDVSMMPVFQILEYPGTYEVEGLYKYPNTNIWRRNL